MKTGQKILVGVLLSACAGGAVAQDLGNGVAATNHLVENLDDVLAGITSGSATDAALGANELVGDLVTDMADGTPLAQFAPQDVAAGDQLTATLTTSLTPALNGPAASFASAASPIIGLYFPSPLLSQGVPFLIDDERIVPFEQTLGLTSGLPLAELDMLFKIDLLGPGDNDGGGVAIPVFGGDDLGGFSSFGGLSSFGGFAEGGNVPVIGMLLDGGLPMLSGGASGLSAEEIPLPLTALDPETLAGLLGGNPLGGLGMN